MLEGVILKGIGGFYYIDTERGVYECRARGIFRKEGIRPTVGDAVRISVLDEEKKKGSLDEILPRRNELIRPRVSNVDQAVIVFAAKSPNMNLDLLDRFLLLAEEQELDIVIVINKIDKDKKENYLAEAHNFAMNAYEHLSKARMEEEFPIAGMNETTLDYLLSYLGYVKGEYQTAMQYLSGVVSTRGISPRLKDKCLELKELLNQKLHASADQ